MARLDSLSLVCHIRRLSIIVNIKHDFCSCFRSELDNFLVLIDGVLYGDNTPFMTDKQYTLCHI